jgi:hypothetical protein
VDRSAIAHQVAAVGVVRIGDGTGAEQNMQPFERVTVIPDVGLFRDVADEVVVDIDQRLTQDRGCIEAVTKCPRTSNPSSIFD